MELNCNEVSNLIKDLKKCELNSLNTDSIKEIKEIRINLKKMVKFIKNYVLGQVIAMGVEEVKITS